MGTKICKHCVLHAINWRRNRTWSRFEKNEKKLRLQLQKIHGRGSTLFRNKRLQKAQEQYNVELVETPWNRLNERQKFPLKTETVKPSGSSQAPELANSGVDCTVLISKLSVDPYHILTLTFTNRAAREMRHRINEIVGDESVSSQITMGTFHATCLSILRKDIEKISFADGHTGGYRNPTGLGSIWWIRLNESNVFHY